MSTMKTMHGIDLDSVASTRSRALGLARETLRDLSALPPRYGIAGCIGDALFACEFAHIDPSIDASWWLARAIRAFNTRGGGASLHRGLAGLGFVLAVYGDAAGDVEAHLSRIDTALLANLSNIPPASLQNGVAGVALYASARSHAETGRCLQRAVVAQLAATATPYGDGLLWHTPVAYARWRGLDVDDDATVTELGMVHGVAGTLVALSALAAQGHDHAADLAHRALSATWQRARPEANRFGRIEFGTRTPKAPREFGDRRWCVGDPGVLRALWIAATTIGDTSSATRALEFLREDAVRDVGGDVPGDPSRIDLCCGSSMVAQVYWRTWLETKDDIFRVASERLLARCANAISTLETRTFAYGRAGVLLALLASGSERDPAWDGILGNRLPSA